MILDQAYSLRSSDAPGSNRGREGEPEQPAIFECPNTDEALLGLYAHLKANRELLSSRGVRLLVPSGMAITYANRLSAVIVKYLELPCQVARI